MKTTISWLTILLCCFATLWANQTSVSDNQQYPQFCHQAARDPSIFANFRRHSIYTHVLEHTPYTLSNQYLQIILKDSPEFVQKFELFKQNDQVGNPVLADYGT